MIEEELEELNTQITIADVNRIRFQNNIEWLQEAIKKASELLIDKHPINRFTNISKTID